MADYEDDFDDYEDNSPEKATKVAAVGVYNAYLHTCLHDSHFITIE